MLCRLAGIGVALVLSSSVLAQQPSAAQIEQFKQLPRAQQEALAAQYGVDLSQLTGVVQSAPLSAPAPDLNQLTPARPVNGSDNTRIEKSHNELKDDANTVPANVAGPEQQVKRGLRENLKQFGYDLFAGSPSTFAPVSDVPVPADYLAYSAVRQRNGANRIRS